VGSEQSGAEGSYGLLRGSCQRKDMGDSRGSIGMGGLDKRASILGLGTLSHGYPCGVHLEYTIPSISDTVSWLGRIQVVV